MTYIEKIKRIKSEKKITTADLSEMTGIPVGTLSKIFSGVIEEPKLVTIQAIAEALDYSLDELCNDGNSKNSFNYEEKKLISLYRQSDEIGKRVIYATAEKEANRYKEELSIRDPFYLSDKIYIPLFYHPVSAGRGSLLDGDDYEMIPVKRTTISQKANYALRVSGNSMEPAYHNNDILLVEKTTSVNDGELGIFVGDGEGFFKYLRNGCLHSINPQYDDIPVKNFSFFTCVGKVIGLIKSEKEIL